MSGQVLPKSVNYSRAAPIRAAARAARSIWAPALSTRRAAGDRARLRWRGPHRRCSGSGGARRSRRVAARIARSRSRRSRAVPGVGTARAVDDPRGARAGPADGGGGGRTGRRFGRRATSSSYSRRGWRICRSRSFTSPCSTRSIGWSETSRSPAAFSIRRSCIRARCFVRRSPSGRRRSSSCTITRAAIRRPRRTTGS